MKVQDTQHVSYISIALCLILFTFVISPFTALPKGYGFGNLDFVQYWSAARVAISGGNPYDPEQIRLIESSIPNFFRTEPVLMWNPPWTLTIMAPVLALPFPWATVVWAWAATLMYLSAGALLWRALSGQKSYLIPTAISLAMVLPLHNSLEFGQSSSLVALGFALLFSGVVSGNFFLAGLSLPLVAVKPHVLYLVLFAVTWWCVRNQKLSFFAGGALSFFAAIGLTEAWAPGATLSWINSFFTPHAGSSNVTQWVVATIPGALRLLLQTNEGRIPVWPSLVVPGITVLTVAWWLIRKERDPEWRESLVPLTILSVMTSSYGWVYDQLILVVVPLALAAKIASQESSGKRVLGFTVGVGAIYGLLLYLSKIGIKYQHEMFWISAIPACIWLLRGRFIGKEGRAPGSR